MTMARIVDMKRENIKAALMSIHQIGADYVHGKIADFILVAMLQSEVEQIKGIIKR